MTSDSGAMTTPTIPIDSPMRWIPGGAFRMGSSDFYPEERPVHEVTVGGFWIDIGPVTVADFSQFVQVTRYVTVAERPLRAEDYPTVDPLLLVPGALVFHRTAGPVDLRDPGNWWSYVPGANWRHPEGPHSDLSGRDRHPVTQVAYEDAEAYAAWACKELPTEAEWEFAARGGLDDAVYAWGDEFAPDGRHMANTWQGDFPWQNLGLEGYISTSPVGVFPANGYGLLDMAGNVWEWTSEFFTAQHRHTAAKACCTPDRPMTAAGTAIGSAEPGSAIARKVTKGGSYLCAPNYCHRYRPAARQAEAVDTATCHIGFRCVKGGPS